jgi:hypothetical protein
MSEQWANLHGNDSGETVKPLKLSVFTVIFVKQSFSALLDRIGKKSKKSICSWSRKITGKLS